MTMHGPRLQAAQSSIDTKSRPIELRDTSKFSVAASLSRVPVLAASSSISWLKRLVKDSLFVASQLLVSLSIPLFVVSSLVFRRLVWHPALPHSLICFSATVCK